MDLYRRILSSDHTNDQDCYQGCNAYSPPPTSNADDSNTILLPNLVIGFLSITAAAFFFAVTYYLVLTHRRRLRRRRRRRRPIFAAPPFRLPYDGGDETGSEDEGSGDHHIWHIRTVGLDESTIGSIGASLYCTEDSTVADCSVCLVDFRDGELVRMLPKCGHAFHVSCIDTWLRAHVSCPLCRAHIVAPADPAPPPTGDPVSFSLSENTQMRILPLGSDGRDSEGEGEDLAMESGIGIVIDPLAELPESSELWVPIDLGEGGIQPVRRSVSMDFSSVEFGEERKDPNFGEQSATENSGKQGSTSSKGASLQKYHIGIGRSLSSTGSGFFFSRLGRARSSSILPL